MKKTGMQRFFCASVLIFAALLAVAPVWAEDGYVRLAVKGTHVNLRPQPRSSGSVVAQMNAGDMFIAEKYPIVCDDDASEWYRIVLAVDAKTNGISILSEWDSRFRLNVAFVRADFTSLSPLEKGDMEKILATPVGVGYSFDTDPHGSEFPTLIADNFRFFAYYCSLADHTDIYDANPHDGGAKVTGRYKGGDTVRLLGRNSDGDAYAVMDPFFKRLPGFVEASAVDKEYYHEGQKLDFNAFSAFCQRYVGANIGEIVRKWGHFKVERKVVDNFGDGNYVIFSSLTAPDMQISFYEWLPEADGSPQQLLSIALLNGFDIARKGAGIGGIYIGVDWCGKEWVKKLLGAPDATDRDARGEYWGWHSEFNDVKVHFEGGVVSSVALDARPAD